MENGSEITFNKPQNAKKKRKRGSLYRNLRCFPSKQKVQRQQKKKKKKQKQGGDTPLPKLIFHFWISLPLALIFGRRFMRPTATEKTVCIRRNIWALRLFEQQTRLFLVNNLSVTTGVSSEFRYDIEKTRYEDKICFQIYVIFKRSTCLQAKFSANLTEAGIFMMPKAPLMYNSQSTMYCWMHKPWLRANG